MADMPDNLAILDLENTLKCPVCFELRDGYIFVCQRGHHLCSVCSRSLINCPTCQCAITACRNFVVESLISKYGFLIVEQKTKKKKRTLFNGEPELPPLTVFDLFLQHFTKENSHLSPQQCEIQAAAQWKKLSQSEKDKFQKKLEQAKSEYMRQLDKFVLTLNKSELKEYFLMIMASEPSDSSEDSEEDSEESSDEKETNKGESSESSDSLDSE